MAYRSSYDENGEQDRELEYDSKKELNGNTVQLFFVLFFNQLPCEQYALTPTSPRL